MSALSFLSGYGSTSEDSDIDSDTSCPKKLKLHLPDLSGVPVVPDKIHLDEPSLHGGRIRSFPHVRGNWASFVYLKYPKEEFLHNLCERFLAALHPYQGSCHICEDIHVSLSKTVILQYHLITLFTKSLQEAVTPIKCFDLEFASVNIYNNEDNSRTFISLKVDCFTKNKLINLTKKIDSVLEEFRLPLFYEKPSFHMSILWLNGNKKLELTRFLEDFNYILKEEIGSNINPVLMSHVHCKIGNKLFQFGLE